MAEASNHDENVEDFVAAEVFVFVVENRELQGIDDSADGVDDSACEEPAESSRCEGIYNLAEGEDAGPSHSDIEEGRDPFRTKYPECFDENPDSRDCPDDCKECDSGAAAEYEKAYRCVGSCNQDENHHVVYFFKNRIYLFGNVEGVVSCACRIKQYQTDDVNGKRSSIKCAVSV